MKISTIPCSFKRKLFLSRTVNYTHSTKKEASKPGLVLPFKTRKKPDKKMGKKRKKEKGTDVFLKSQTILK